MPVLDRRFFCLAWAGAVFVWAASSFATPARVTIGRIDIFPLVAVDTEKLRVAVPIRIGDELDADAITSAVRTLENVVRAGGRPAVAVVPYSARLTTSSLALGFMIEGHEPPVMRKITLDGIGLLNRIRIRSGLKKLQPVPFDKGLTVTVAMLESARALIEGGMRSQGYLDARAWLDSTEISAKGLLHVTYKIECGSRYSVAEGRASGARYAEPSFWQPEAGALDGRKLTYERVKNLEQSLEQRAQTQGYMAPKVDIDIQPVAGADHTVNVVARVDEGTTNVLGRVKIERTAPKAGYGDTWYHRRYAPPLSDDIVLRQVRARSGDPLDLWLLQNTERRLRGFGTFDKVEAVTVPTSDSIVRDLKLMFEERLSGSVDFTAGWSDTLGALGGIRAVERNIGGRGDQLSAELNLYGAGYDGEISWFDRYWDRGARWLGQEREPSLLWSAFSRQRNFGQYTENRTGISSTLGYLIGEPRGPWSNSWNARIEQVGYSAGNFGSGRNIHDYLAATLAYQIVHDRRNGGEFDATRGLLWSASIETGAADGWLLRGQGRFERYRPLSRRFTWSAIGNLGLMPTDATAVGLGHRFQAGGIDSLLGFEERGIGPVDSGNERLHTGGATLLTLRNELRYQMSERIQIPLILDAGTLGQGPLELGAPRASVGIGGRYFMRDNRIGYLYVGKSLLREETDNDMTISFGFSFSLGRPTAQRRQ